MSPMRRAGREREVLRRVRNAAPARHGRRSLWRLSDTATAGGVLAIIRNAARRTSYLDVGPAWHRRVGGGKRPPSNVINQQLASRQAQGPGSRQGFESPL